MPSADEAKIWGRSVLQLDGGLLIHLTPKVALRSTQAAIPEEVHDRGAYLHIDDPAPGFRFMLVRDPHQRFVSMWSYLCLAKPLSRWKARFSSNLAQLGYRAGMPFAEFADVCLANSHRNLHTATQMYYRGPHEIDLLSRLENVDAAWAELRRRFPYLLDFPHRNRSDHVRRQDVMEHYTPEIRRRVEETYAPDFELYEQAR